MSAKSNGTGQDASDILTVEEVAKYLKTHPSTISRMAREGVLPAFRLGMGQSHWRFTRGAIQQFIAQRTANSTNS